ncbi:carbamoyltransferase HypF [Jiella marina]|uniref:carbamoyltransferase HypF n=1 Tax=Jiella sp. LLJ827 TaxID=2917712 RepID=UPI002101D1F5|nr:carbamoyltransferase HypF [Jiella sp. LLJ827]MCQ0988207.1 carbamoyltransferase HypF [Jiella sp. LLJ827]
MSEEGERQGLEIRVTGQVQGVGFRPFVWRLAQDLSLSGNVLNDAEGVLIRLGGKPDDLARFRAKLREEAPPLSRIDEITEIPLVRPPEGAFAIEQTAGGAKRTGVTPDAAICAACRAEISDPAERRYRYPFANCTDCGPRFSIIDDIPYDRAATRMRHFAMCEACRAEYENPADRRYHAQPIACPDCGPRLSLIVGGRRVEADPIEESAALLKAGRIVAIKGLGGFHLACDAMTPEAIATLRRRKRRPAKPFALMAQDLETIERHARLPSDAATALASAAAPIVLLERAGEALPDGLAPGLNRLGWMLPMTPLHVLLAEAAGRPLVMTSGNLSGEPQVITEDEAFDKLGGIADAFLIHDREIARRLDDSVAMAMGGHIRLVRRGRGFAPARLRFPASLRDAPPILALGGELKSAICLVGSEGALLSHHMGDLEDALSFAEFEKAIADYLDLFGEVPQAIACDAHPAYRSTEVAEAMAAERGIPLVSVQHHHAHIAAVMAEHGWNDEEGAVLGIALDGTGFGGDGTVWGGEFLLATYRDFSRLGWLAPVPLPGGAAAVAEPWRNLLAQLRHAFGPEGWRAADGRLGLSGPFAERPTDAVERMIASGLNTPLTSSAGRLFDALGAALGCSFERTTHEGQAAMEAEALAGEPCEPGDAYRFDRTETEGGTLLDPVPAFRSLVEDVAAGGSPALVSACFHDGFADAAADLATSLARRHAATTVALSGGVMQNARLFERLSERLSEAGLTVLGGQEVPMTDGGLAFGQAAIAAARLARSG